MYSKDEASKLRQTFWTSFGQYIAPIPSADGLRVNWVNYKTGLKQVFFKMNASHQYASIAIEICHTDIGIQELFFEQFLEFKTMLHTELKEEWEWQLHTHDDLGRTISRISKTSTPLNIFKEEDWPQLISFFKPRIIALDEFWCTVKESFEVLK